MPSHNSLIDRLCRFLRQSGGTLGQKVVRSGIWVALSSAALASLSFVRAVILARLLAPEHFGLMATCLIVLRGVQVFSETGLAAATIQRVRDDMTDVKPTVYSLMALRGALLAVIVLVSSPWVANFFAQPALQPMLAVLACSLLLGGLGSVEYIVLQRELNFRPQVALQQLLAVIEFLAVVLLAWWLRNAWALLLGHVLKVLLSVPLSFALLHDRPRPGWNRVIAGELLRYGKFITGVTIVVYVTSEIDNVVIGRMIGMEALGAYALAYMLANLPATHLSKIISSIMFPAYSKLQGDLPGLQRAFLETRRLVAMLAVPASVGIAVLADELVEVMFGPKWSEAAVVLPALCVFGGLRAVSAINGYVLNAIGKPQLSFYINLAKLVLIAAVIVPATAHYGMLGTALAIVFPSLVTFVAGEFVFSRTVGLPLRSMLEVLAATLASTTVMALALVAVRYWVSLRTPLALCAAVALGGLLYLALNRSQMATAIRRLMAGRIAA